MRMFRYLFKLSEKDNFPKVCSVPFCLFQSSLSFFLLISLICHTRISPPFTFLDVLFSSFSYTCCSRVHFWHICVQKRSTSRSTHVHIVRCCFHLIYYQCFNFYFHLSPLALFGRQTEKNKIRNSLAVLSPKSFFSPTKSCLSIGISHLPRTFKGFQYIHKKLQKQPTAWEFQ